MYKCSMIIQLNIATGDGKGGGDATLNDIWSTIPSE